MEAGAWSHRSLGTELVPSQLNMKRTRRLRRLLILAIRGPFYVWTWPAASHYSALAAATL